MEDDRDDSDERRKRKKDRDKAPPEPHPVEPIVHDHELFGFLADLFDGHQEFPERIDVRVLRGRDLSTVGVTVKQFVWPVGKPKPNKEEIVKQSNEITHLLRRDCDTRRRPMFYRVDAVHFSRSPEPYATHVVRVEPGATYRDGADGEYASDESDFGDDASPVVKFLERRLDKEERYNRHLFEQTLNALSGALERSDAWNDRLMSTVEGSYDARLRYVSAAETMLNNSAERENARMRELAKQRRYDLVVDKGLAAAGVVASMIAPQLMSKLGTGQTATAPGPNAANVFLRSLTADEQIEAFGPPDEEKNPTGGIFSREQFDQLVEIANADEPDNEMIVHFAASITTEQRMQAVQLFGTGRLMPLLKWFTERTANGAATVEQ